MPKLRAQVPLIARRPTRVGPLGALRRRRAPEPPPGIRGTIGRLDQALLRAMRTRLHQPQLLRPMQAIGIAGEWAAVWVALGLAGAIAEPPKRKRFAIAAATGPAAVVINFAVKVTVGRERPLIEDHPALARAPTKLSFPSAHATSSMAAATALSRVEPRARIPLYGLATLICVGRPYLGMHYPSDVLAGAALGIALGRLVPGLDRDGVERRLSDLAEASHASSAPAVAPGAVA